MDYFTLLGYGQEHQLIPRGSVLREASPFMKCSGVEQESQGTTFQANSFVTLPQWKPQKVAHMLKNLLSLTLSKARPVNKQWQNNTH